MLRHLPALSVLHVLFAPVPAYALECPHVPSAELVSWTTSGSPATGRSQYPSLTHDGRYVAFNSTETDLVPDDANGWEDVFIRDRWLETIERISVAHDGGETDERSYTATITPDGMFIAFASQATNVIPDDTNESQDIFLRDLTTGVVERVSITDDELEANGHSIGIAITPDARYVAFTSQATNLVADDPNAEIRDVFVRDRVAGTTERVNAGIVVGPSLQTPFAVHITPDGRYVTFVTSYATVPGDPQQIQHFQGYVHDRSTGVTERVTTNSDGLDNDAAAGTLGCFDMTISDDGRFVAFQCNGDNLVPYDNYGSDDVFVKDRETGLTERVSVTDTGAALSRSGYRGQISGDGRFVAFLSTAAEYGAPGVGSPPPMAIVLHDRFAGMTKPILIQDASPQFVGFSGSDFTITPLARYAAYGAPLNSSQGAPPKDIFFQDRGEAGPRVLAVETTCGDEDLVVSAQIVSPPLLITEGTVLGNPAARSIGAELYEARLVLRPERDDIFVRIGVRSIEQAKTLETVTVPKAVRYRLTFAIEGFVHEVLIERLSGPNGSQPSFTLFSCPGGECEESATLVGGFGTSGEAIRFAIPLEHLPAGPAAVTGVSVATARVDGGSEQALDAIDLPDGSLPGRSVEIGVAEEGVPEEAVAFVAATLNDCLFTASFPDVPAGPIRIWTRVCEGMTCEVASIPCTHVVGVPDGGGEAAPDVTLTRSVPNPFSGSSSVRLTLADAMPVTLAIYDATGRRVRTLVDGLVGAGVRDLVWDGTDDTGEPVADGVYFYRLTSGGVGSISRKLLRVR